MLIFNKPFPNSLVPLFQSESKCETTRMKMTDLLENETACRTHFLMKGFAHKLVLKQAQENSEMAYLHCQLVLRISAIVLHKNNSHCT